jgi:hypothetical protein
LGSEQLLFGLADAEAPSGNVTSISPAQSSEWVTITWLNDYGLIW